LGEKKIKFPGLRGHNGKTLPGLQEKALQSHRNESMKAQKKNQKVLTLDRGGGQKEKKTGKERGYPLTWGGEHGGLKIGEKAGQGPKENGNTDQW